MHGKFEIELPNGYKLIAEQNADPNYPNEIYVGVLDDRGAWHQDLAVIRAGHMGDPFSRTNKNFEVLVYSDAYDEDYTHRFSIDMYEGV